MIDLEKGFFHCENVSKGSHCFPKIKIEFLIFHFKYYEPTPNSKICLIEVQKFEQIPSICLNFDLKTFGLPPLYMQITWSRSFLGIIFLFVNLFSKFL